MSAALHLSKELDLPLEVVTEATAIVATRGAGKSSSSAVFVEEAFGLSVQSVVLDRTGVYHGLRSNRRGNGAGLEIYVLGGPHGDAPLEPNAGVLIADLIVDTGHSFVLDLSDFSKSAAVRFAAGGVTNSVVPGPDRWRAALPTAAREVFDYLVEKWPEAIPAEEIGTALGRAARGGSWNTALATLVRNGLAVRVLDGLAATEEAVGR